jgi:hypothetical protein
MKLSRAAGLWSHDSHAPGGTGGREAADAAGRPLGSASFIAFAVISFGGPLALAGLIAPAVISGAGSRSGSSAGLEVLLAAVIFVAPMVIWLRYAKHIQGAGGLYDYVKAAAGPQVAFVQAAIWTVSYLLYIIYTTEQIVYDLLPAVLPGERSLETLLALLIPLALVVVMVGGRRTAMITAALLAVSQMLLVVILDVVTLAHVSASASTFGTGSPAGELAKSGFQNSLLYICGSLPLFLGGELVRPAVTIRRGMIGVYVLTAVVTLLAVAPLAADPGLLRAPVASVSLANRFVGHGLGDAIAVGLAISTFGVMLAEYFALTRLVHAVSSWALRPITLVIAAVVVIAAPLMLIDPQGLYNALSTPSLVALWLSQLIVFAVYPLFARAHGQRLLPACALSLFTSGLAIYGLIVTLQNAS